MGWKGTVRSIGAAVRAAERDTKKRQRDLERNEKRRQRELEQKKKQYEKMQELEQAAYEVEVYENHIDVILSTHKECSPVVDWKHISLSKQPREPKKSNEKEKEARLLFDNYKSGFIERLLKKDKIKRAFLFEKITAAIVSDEADHNSKVSIWEKEVEEWTESVAIAEVILGGDTKSKIEAIENFQPFAEISNLGSSLLVSIHDNGILEIKINIHGTEIIPKKSKSLLKSGKLSVKNIPKGKFNEMYQDYVCSCVLRVGNELFSIIPDHFVLVTAVDELLNTQTGHLEEAPILSVALSRKTIEGLNLEAIDPSDSMTNFKHNMSFKKTTGFDRVEHVSSEGLHC